MLRLYHDLLARVRGDNQPHSIRSLVRPDDPEVREIARALAQANDFVGAAQDFVNSFTTYRREIGDYWTVPAELLAAREGDCDDKAILLESLLRNYIPAEDVYCAFGSWRQNGSAEGHMWIVMANGSTDRIIEATAPSRASIKGNYQLEAIFNDRYAFAYPQAIEHFELVPVEIRQEAEVV